MNDRAVLVLGMHRSGTSCLAGMLAAGGVASAGDAIRNWDNARGHFEMLGLDLDETEEPYLDYGFAVDFHASWPSSAAIDIYACDQSIDQVRYDSLPRTGTYSLGAMPPTEETNDFPTSWCTDTTINANSFPGTPQRANTACP